VEIEVVLLGLALRILARRIGVVLHMESSRDQIRMAFYDMLDDWNDLISLPH
jgi:hypothetical protein